MRPQLSSRRSASLLCTALLFGACTDPTAIGPEPSFITLVDASETVSDWRIRSSIPADSCPPFRPPTSPTVRRTVPGSGGMTIAIPEMQGLSVASLAPDAGIAFELPNEGLIIVTLDRQVPVFDRFRARQPGVPFIQGFGHFTPLAYRQCRVTANGRDAALHLDYLLLFSSRRPAVTDTIVSYNSDMLLSVTNAAGRSAYITLLGRTPENGGFFGESRVLRLLPYAASVQW